VRQAQALQSEQMRRHGRTWAEIAEVFRATYRVNPRVAMRQAHGWSQPQAAERWTARWPEDPKTFKNFSYWEQWPGSTGHAPSLDTLDRLAQLYQCKVTDLLTDCRDYGGRPAVRNVVRDRSGGPGHAADGRQPFRPFPAAGRGQHAPLARPSSVPALQSALETIRQAQASEMMQTSGDADDPGRRLRRRSLLLEASSALALVAAAPVLEVPRLAVGASATGRVRTDLAIVTYAAEVVAGLRRLGGAVGPRITLPPAMALRSAMAALARNAPDIITGQALTAYGDLTQLIGWLMFNLGDHKSARYYYDDARSAAYRASNHDLAAYALSASGHLAIAQGRFRQAIEHAQAAQQEARASGSPYAVAYAADVTARSYAGAGQIARCQAALDRERAALGNISEHTVSAPWWYFYDRSFYWGTESECALKLDMPVDAYDAAGRALGQLGQLGPLNLHNSALTLALRAEALIKQGEIEVGCQALADAARLTTLNSSQRIAGRIGSLRTALRAFDDTAAVRELDEKLAEYRQARSADEAETAP
jgi:tetratricopeptide (TPR) repeat protein